MKKISLILSAITICLCISTFFIISYGYAANDSGLVNTLDKVVDESVNIPEPEANKGKVPAHIRWEPMLGCYIVKDAIYNPDTKSFIILEEGLETIVDPGSEASRIQNWINVKNQTEDILYIGLLAYEKSKGENLSASSIRQISNNKVVINDIIPLGIPYLNEMLDMVVSQKLFDIPLMYAIEQIAGVTCKPDNMSFDDYEPTHDSWRSNLKNLFGSVEVAVMNKENLDKYGLFALPYLIDYNKADLKKLLIAKKDILSKNGFLMMNMDNDLWIEENKEKIEQIRFCIEKYK